MEVFNFSKEAGKKISAFQSDFIMSRILQTTKGAHIGCMHLEEKGVIGYHQAVIPQLLLVVSGEGFVSTQRDEYFKVQSGDAVFWEKDEWHETKTDTGLTAIVIESEELNPAAYMPRRENHQ
ncbi:cupin domain-containing protein [Neobacillus sp. DY30]|uniref:cupin domain-containing protein n=1 Tax=Neobacillus sp. DY30 TaxID=3047871 RepID=UPI0024C05B6B|nr:cupin domain-containing protein [Neobacillus sp. DY30]WHY00474.1 cupin domain-containing protein [Neobacillus sp. DY30]